MSMNPFLIVAFFLFSPYLLAQQFVDVFPDGIYIQEYSDFKGRGIVKINHDLSVEHFLPPVLPNGLELKKIINGIRPKIRLDSFWISDKHRIYKKPLEAVPNQEWELVKVPDRIAQFKDFEIISDKEAIICGCMFSPDPDAPNSLPPLDMHFVFNYKTGNVTTTIESVDVRAIPYDLYNDINTAYYLKKISDSYMCRFDSRIVIVGKYSGFVTILDIKY